MREMRTECFCWLRLGTCVCGRRRRMSKRSYRGMGSYFSEVTVRGGGGGGGGKRGGGCLSLAATLAVVLLAFFGVRGLFFLRCHDGYLYEGSQVVRSFFAYFLSPCSHENKGQELFESPTINTTRMILLLYSFLLWVVNKHATGINILQSNSAHMYNFHTRGETPKNSRVQSN